MAVIRLMNGTATRRLFAFTVAAYAIAWGAELPMILLPQRLSITSIRGLELLFVASIAPSLVAVVIAWADGRAAGVRALLRPAGRWRVPLSFYVIVSVLPTVLMMTAQSLPALWGAALPLTFTGPNLWTSTVSPVGEEFGWRGFLLPGLQRRMGALRASLLLGVIWAAWHLPQWFIPGARFSAFPVFAVRVIAESIFLGWLYNRTRSLLLCIIAHAAMNLSVVTVYPVRIGGIWPSVTYMGLFCGVAAVIVWRTNPMTLTEDGPRSLSLVVDGEAGPDHAPREAYPA